MKIEIPFNFPCKNEIDQISFYALLIEAVISTILEMKMISENTFISMKIFMRYNISIERIAHKSCYATKVEMKVLLKVTSTPDFESQTYDLQIEGIPYIFEDENVGMKFKEWLVDQFIDHIVNAEYEFINAHPVDAHD